MASNEPTVTAPKTEAHLDATATITTTQATQAKPDQQPKWPGWPGDLVYRLIVPVMKVGGIIGRKGEAIKKLCEETRARVRVLDAPLASPHCIVLISSREEPEAVLSPAMVAVMRISKQLNGLPESDEDNTKSSGDASVAFCSVHLLVASVQALNLIGKQGATIKLIEESSGAAIQVLSSDEVPTLAIVDEKVVELKGEAVKVFKALQYVVQHLRKFLVHHSVLPLFEKRHYGTSVDRQTENCADKKMMHPTSTMQAGMVSDDYSLSVKREMLYFDRERNQNSLSSLSGLPYYGQRTGLSGTSSVGRGPIITKVTQTMQIPLTYANDIIGVEGSNIAYIRHASGAVLTVQESMALLDEVTIEIKGRPSEVQAAKQLIQECITRQEEVILGSYVNTEPDPWSSYSFERQQYELQYPYGSSGFGGYGNYRM